MAIVMAVAVAVAFRACMYHGYDGDTFVSFSLSSLNSVLAANVGTSEPPVAAATILRLMLAASPMVTIPSFLFPKLRVL